MGVTFLALFGRLGNCRRTQRPSELRGFDGGVGEVDLGGVAGRGQEGQEKRGDRGAHGGSDLRREAD